MPMRHCTLMYPYLGFLLREARVATIDGGKAELARLGGGVAQAVMRLTATLKYCDTLPQYWEIKGREERKARDKELAKNFLTNPRSALLFSGPSLHPRYPPAHQRDVDPELAWRVEGHGRTAVCPVPPHRPVRAALPHTVLASGSGVEALQRIRVADTSEGKPPVHETGRFGGDIQLHKTGGRVPGTHR